MSTNSEIEQRAPAYSCTVGHLVLSKDLEQQTERVRLDTGAEVLICREHGAPIAVTLPPGSSLSERAPLL
ncbi:MAG: hypothetical protein M3Z66_06950 [Chloroflexota bacterium]|nr:hypothetical protein [Chloroflexota bacterium]